jgi:CRP/FNR family cyclic AMP-dependent transcriptional regulator
MTAEAGEAAAWATPGLTAGPVPGRRRPLPGPRITPYYAYLLDADDELAEEFDVRTRIVARQATAVRVLAADPGLCDLWPAFDAARLGAGLLILDGLIACETSIAGRTAAELVGTGDLLQPPIPRPDEVMQIDSVWQVLWPTKLALLDAGFGDRVRPWPRLMVALLRRVGRRVSDVDAMRAITSHPRLELRLVLLFWHLAARWGRVEPTGIHLTLPLTHRLLGRLVGAERPSISHAMTRLSQAGLVTGTAGDIHLRGTFESQLDNLLEHTTIELASG